MNGTDEPTTTQGTQEAPRSHRRATRVAATLVAGAALGAAAFAGVQGLDSSGTSTSTTASATTSQVTTVVQSAASYDAAAIYDKASPGVVDITVTTSSQSSSDGTIPPFGPGSGSSSAEGTGFVYDKSGHIVTAAHVVDGATAISVRFKDGTPRQGHPRRHRPLQRHRRDQGRRRRRRSCTPIALADSSAVEPGQGVVAIGSPFGYEESITAGIVSAVGRSIEAPNGFTIPNAIQTDAAINHGNSGGPLIDASGKVIGVNVQIATGDSSASINAGVGFAVPSNTVKAVVTDLIAGKTVSHPYLGVTVGDNQSGTGAVIGTVRAGSPAAKAGLKSGDVVTAIDGKAVAGSSQLTSAIATYEPGDKIALTVKRNGSTVTVNVTLGTQARDHRVDQLPPSARAGRGGASASPLQRCVCESARREGDDAPRGLRAGHRRQAHRRRRRLVADRPRAAPVRDRDPRPRAVGPGEPHATPCGSSSSTPTATR